VSSTPPRGGRRRKKKAWEERPVDASHPLPSF